MQNKDKEKRVSPLGKVEPEFKFNIGTVVFIIIGSIISWLNMLIIYASMEIIAYLSIIFTTSIPGVIISYKNRYWGYGYMLGFSIAGIPFMILVDLFVGGYVFATTLFILIIMWLVFWKVWRSLSKVSHTKQDSV